MYSYLKRAKTELGFHFSKEATAMREEIFNEMDVDKNGQIDKEELEVMWQRFDEAYSKLMCELKMENHLDRKTFMDIVNTFDSVEYGGNNDGLINSKEFSAMLLHITNELDLKLDNVNSLSKE